MFSGVTRLVNAKFLLKTPHIKRVTFVACVMGFAFLLIATCAFDPDGLELFFWLSLVASVLQGSSCALGESTTLGFLKGFPSECVGFFSSGTGFAGIFGTSLLLILKAAGL